MSKLRRIHKQAATAAALAWTFYEADDFDVDRITLKFASAPTLAENITVTLDSAQGATYDTVVLSVDPRGSTSIDIEGINGFLAGDKVLVSFANTSTISITGTATVAV